MRASLPANGACSATGGVVAVLFFYNAMHVMQRCMPGLFGADVSLDINQRRRSSLCRNNSSTKRPVAPTQWGAGFSIQPVALQLHGRLIVNDRRKRDGFACMVTLLPPNGRRCSRSLASVLRTSTPTRQLRESHLTKRSCLAKTASGRLLACCLLCTLLDLLRPRWWYVARSAISLGKRYLLNRRRVCQCAGAFCASSLRCAPPWVI